MPEKKFDLNKALQAAQLYTPIDYGYTPQFDISTSVNDFNNTTNNVLSDIDWVGSSVRARKEEQEKRDNLPWHSKLGYQLMTVPQDTSLPLYSQSAADRLMVGDYAGAEAIQKPIDTVATIATGAGLLGTWGISGLLNAAATYGWPAALTAEGLSWGTGAAGYHGFDKLGNWIDNTYGTNTRKWLPLVGSMFTGMAGYNGYLRHNFGKNFGTIKFNRDSKPSTDILQNYMADGSEQYVFDNGKNVLKVHVDNTGKNLKNIVSYNKQWVNGRNIVPGQVKLRHKGFIQDATTGNYYPVNSQLKADRILDDSMNVKDWEYIMNSLKLNNGINIDDTFTKNGNAYKIYDFKPSNIGLYKNEPKFIDIAVSKIK